MNVDAQEIEKFEQMAHGWWDPQGDFKPLHQLNPLRLNWISQHCDGLFGKKILDVGCGGGILSESMAAQGATVTGIDLGATPLEVARLHAKEQNIEIDYQQIAVEALAETQAGQYDVVTCMEMLEHVPDPASIVKACATLVRPGGKVFFSTINKTTQSWVEMIVGAEYLLRLVPKGTHEHQRFIRPAQLMRFCDQGGLLTREIAGVRYNPLTQTFRLSSQVAVNYQIYCERPEA